jgi:hypothetical protein
LIAKLFGVGVAGVGRRVAALIVLAAIERPVRVVEGERLGVTGGRVGDGRTGPLHFDDHLGASVLLAFVERPHPDGHLQILLLAVASGAAGALGLVLRLAHLVGCVFLEFLQGVPLLNLI